MPPLPPYVEWFAVAREIGIPVTELADVEPYVIAAAQALLIAKQRVTDARDAEHRR